MRRLLNTLYVTTPEAYLSLDGENIIVLKEDAPMLRVPLHNLEGIVAFGYTGANPARRSGSVSAIFVEMRRANARIDHV